MQNDKLLGEIRADGLNSDNNQKKRWEQWNENYLLYRDKVVTNRLVQRQPVNVGIIRETVRTWVSKIDEAPKLSYKAKGRANADKKAELIWNELYSFYYTDLKLDLLDNQEKKIVALQGRCFKKIGFDHENNKPFVSIIDPYDIEIDPRCNIFDLETANYINHKHIYRALRTILANDKYDSKGKDDLKKYLDSNTGIIESGALEESRIQRDARLQALGKFNFDEFGARDTVVEIKECYKLIWDNASGKFVRYLIIIAANNAILYKKPLKDALGVDFLPFITWADDPDINDIWCDGVADAVRSTNKIGNVYMSQTLENRTYINFGMTFYDNTNEKFMPETLDPKPFGFYGVPGKPSDIMQQMDIKPLTGTIEEMEYFRRTAQTSVAITPSELGIEDGGEKTLGAKKLNLSNSQGRLTPTAKNYRAAWKEFGWKFYEIVCANMNDKITLYKKGVDDEYYPADIYPKDLKSVHGFELDVIFQSERDQQDQSALEKAQFVQQQFASNPAAQKIAKRKALETLGWTPDEIQEVQDAEDQMMANAANGGIGAGAVGSGIDPVVGSDMQPTPDQLLAQAQSIK